MKYPIKSQTLCHEHINPPMRHEKWKKSQTNAKKLLKIAQSAPPGS